MSETGRYALIISNSEYEDPKLATLTTPEVDAEALAAVLGDPQIGGFDDVKIMANVSAQEARIAIENFFAEKKLNDLLLLYFTGHGVLDRNNRLYLAARDTRFRSDPFLLRKATAIEAGFIREEMNNTRSRRIVLVLDCCHSGAFEAGAMSGTDVAVGTGAAFEGNGIGRVVLTASDATQFAWQGDTLGSSKPANSVFTKAIVEGLRTGDADVDNDGQVSIHELYEYVQARVKELSSETRPQTPRMWTYGQRGAFLIARAARRREAAREGYRKVVQLVQDGEWDAASEKWQSLQRQYPDLQDDYHVARRIVQWEEAQARYREMQRLVLARRGSEALTLWAQIKKTFPQFEDTRKLVREAEDAIREQEQRRWLNERYGEMEKFCEQRQWGAALQVWQAILEADPYYPDHRRLAQRAQEAQKERQRKEEAQALRRRLDMLYGEMAELVAQKRWKQAEERWQMIRGFDQSYVDKRGLAPLIRVGLREIELERQARERHKMLNTRYRELLAQVRSEEWEAALQSWQSIMAVDESYVDHENVVPLIRRRLGEGSTKRQPQAAPDTQQRRGCLRPIVLFGALATLAVVGVAGIVLLLVWAQGLSPTPTPRFVDRDEDLPGTVIEPIEGSGVNNEDLFEDANAVMPTPLIPETAGCPFVADGFALFTNLIFGPFFTSDGLGHEITSDGVWVYARDSFGTVLPFSLPQRNEWLSLSPAPFAACVDDSGQHYARFIPY